MTLTSDQRAALVEALENPDCEYKGPLGNLVTRGVLSSSHDYRRVWLTSLGRLLAEEIRAHEMCRKVLREVEWARSSAFEGEEFCPSCDHVDCIGHSPDCELAELIK